MIDHYKPTTDGIDVFLDKPPAQPKRAVIEAVDALGICATPRVLSDLDEAVAFVDQSEEADVLVRSEDPKEYAGASGIFNSVLLRIRLQEARDEGFHFPSLEEYLAIDTGIAAVSGDREVDGLLDEYYLPHELGKASLSYWEYVPGKKVIAVRDAAREDTVHLIDERSWHARNTHTGSTEFFQAGTDLRDDEYDRVAEQFIAIEESGLFDPNAAYLGEFVMRDTGEVVLVQMHHTGNKRGYDHEAIPPGEFTHEWSKASLVAGATDGITNRIVTRAMYGQDREVIGANPEIVDLSVHPSLGSLARNIYGYRARTQFHHLHAKDIAPEISRGHSGRSLVFKPALSVAPNVHDNRDFDDGSAINQPEFMLEVASDGHDAYYRVHHSE